MAAAEGDASPEAVAAVLKKHLTQTDIAHAQTHHSVFVFNGPAPAQEDFEAIGHALVPLAERWPDEVISSA
eukprot:5642789-Alexandrium_andersonii.AAC.1